MAAVEEGGGLGLGVSGSSMRVVDRRDQHGFADRSEAHEDKLLKPVPFAGDPDLRALAQVMRAMEGGGGGRLRPVGQ